MYPNGERWAKPTDIGLGQSYYLRSQRPQNPYSLLISNPPTCWGLSLIVYTGICLGIIKSFHCKKNNISIANQHITL